MQINIKENNCGAEDHVLHLLDNMQFVYELHLASLELASFSENGSLLPDFRSFSVNGANDIHRILKRSAYVGKADGELSDYARLTKKNVTRAFNQYITHWFYPYKGKYHPQMVRALANIIGLKEGDTLLDPFVGSGTSAVEAALLGLKGVCFDISPLCVLISTVKANAVHHLDRIEKKERVFALREDHPLTWNPNISRMLDDPVESFELLARMIATSDQARRGEDFTAKLAENKSKMLRSIQLMREGCEEIGINPTPANISIADARNLPLPDSSVEGVITSPPYSLALNYVENDAHSLEALGYDLSRIKEEFIGVRGSGKKRFELYEEDMRKAYAEIVRVMRPGAKACIVLGNVTLNGEEINTVNNCISTMGSLGACLIQKIDKLIYGLYNVMQREWILIFEKTHHDTGRISKATT